MPTAMAASAASYQPVADRLLSRADREAVGEAALRHRCGDQARRTASSEPIERSMPAVRMTKVMPIASRPEIETCRMHVEQVDGERKRGSSDREDRHQHDRKISGAKRARKPKTSSRRVRASPAWRSSVTCLSLGSRRPPLRAPVSSSSSAFLGRASRD